MKFDLEKYIRERVATVAEAKVESITISPIAEYADKRSFAIENLGPLDQINVRTSLETKDPLEYDRLIEMLAFTTELDGTPFTVFLHGLLDDGSIESEGEYHKTFQFRVVQKLPEPVDEINPKPLPPDIGTEGTPEAVEIKPKRKKEVFK